jgi:hypothetical protein
MEPLNQVNDRRRKGNRMALKTPGTEQTVSSLHFPPACGIRRALQVSEVFLLFLWLCSASQVASASEVSFAAARLFGLAPAFTSYSAMGLGDFNQDGKPDLIATTEWGFSVLLADANGGFQAAATNALESLPSAVALSGQTSVAVGDVNGDGKLDFVVGTDLGFIELGRVFVFLSKGDGTFLESTNYLTEPRARSVTLGDFNGDGKLDLVSGGYYGLAVFLGIGDGTFSGPLMPTNVTKVLSLASGDLNGDGKLDLALVSSTSTNVTVLLGVGDGTFSNPIDYAIGGNPAAVVIDDFNGDSKPDLAVVNNSDVTSPLLGSVSILLGRGDGTFGTATTYSAGPHPFALATSELNGDGNRDLVVASAGVYDDPSGSYADPGVYMLLGKGDGTFQNALPYRTGDFIKALLVGDLNGDGNADIAVADSEGIALLSGNGQGQFQNFISVKTGISPSSLTIGDFDEDGLPDLAVTNYGDRTNIDEVLFEHSKVAVYLNKGDGSFKPPILADASPGSAGQMGVADFNGDGHLDLAYAALQVPGFAEGAVAVALGRGDGTLEAPVYYDTSLNPTSVVAADLNHDSKPDLVITGWGAVNNVAVLLSRGDGTFEPSSSFSAGTNWGSVATGDLNHDGTLDLIVAESGGAASPPEASVWVFLGNGDGTFDKPTTLDVTGDFRSVALADFDGDGNLDVSVIHYGSSPNFNDAYLAVALGKGDGSFQAAVTYPIGYSPASITVNDFNGDGKSDLAIASRTGVSVLLGHGDGSFESAVDYAVGESPTTVVSADLNGDGKPDLVVPNFDSQNLSVLVNTSSYPGPKLSIDRSGTAITLSWSSATTPYTIESSPSLNPPSWKAVDSLPVNRRGQWQLTVPPNPTQSYYRLRAPL